MTEKVFIQIKTARTQEETSIAMPQILSSMTSLVNRVFLTYKEEDLLALGNFQALIKLYINGIATSPFMCRTLPLPKSANKNSEKVIKVSSERYSAKVKEVDSEYLENSPDVTKKEKDNSHEENPKKTTHKKEQKDDNHSTDSLPESGEFVLGKE